MIPRISNPKGYTAEQYGADLALVLPAALDDLRRCGFFTICAHCGGPQIGDGTEVHFDSEPGEFKVAWIVSVCDTCVSKPRLPPGEWPYVDETNHLHYYEPDWAHSVYLLKLGPVTSGRYGPCLIIGGW
ncbi:MAG: hypothetical protein WCJ66_17035 [Verrucomicrobiota bacterium]